MGKLLTSSAVFTVLVTLGACIDTPSSPVPDPGDPLLGNGFPQGSHDYLLNIVGVPKDKTADLDDNNGRRIFVQLNGGETVTNGGGKWKPGQSWDDLDKVNKILLAPGDYQVLDANATDDDGALFQLPDPCADSDVSTECSPSYEVYARALGTPGGSATITTCADETGDGFDETDDVWCGSNGVTVTRLKGRSLGVNVTENLLKMVVTVDPDLDPELSACLGTEDDPEVDDPAVTYDVWLFDDCFENYFWNYDNNGLKLLQLRFYSVS